MTVILQPAASGSGGSVPLAANVRGSASAVAPGATVTLVSTTAGANRLRGFAVDGATPGEAWLEVDGVPLAGISARLNVAKTAYFVLPNPEVYQSPSSVVALRVRNDGTVADDYAGVLMQEVG